MLSLGFVSIAGAALPALAIDALDDPAWLTRLLEQLGQQSLWVRREHGAAGMELHCGIRDVAAWAETFSKEAAQGLKVRAAGNVLTLAVAGEAVRVVMHLTAI